MSNDQPDNEARTILGEAIMACNALIIHLNNHPGTFPEETRQRMIEADYLLNSASTDVADFVGEFAPPYVPPGCCTHCGVGLFRDDDGTLRHYDHEGESCGEASPDTYAEEA